MTSCFSLPSGQPHNIALYDYTVFNYLFDTSTDLQTRFFYLIEIARFPRGTAINLDLKITSWLKTIFQNLHQKDSTIEELHKKIFFGIQTLQIYQLDMKILSPKTEKEYPLFKTLLMSKIKDAQNLAIPQVLLSPPFSQYFSKKSSVSLSEIKCLVSTLFLELKAPLVCFTALELQNAIAAIPDLLQAVRTSDPITQIEALSTGATLARSLLPYVTDDPIQERTLQHYEYNFFILMETLLTDLNLEKSVL